MSTTYALQNEGSKLLTHIFSDTFGTSKLRLCFDLGGIITWCPILTVNFFFKKRKHKKKRRKKMLAYKVHTLTSYRIMQGFLSCTLTQLSSR